MKAVLEEADIKIAEVTKDQFEFKRDVNSSASGKPVAEKVLHFLEEKLRIRDSMVDKLNLKNASLKQQISKLENQLQHKEEMGEVLHVIDFDQLKIENQQYLEKIEERNNELLKLKLTTGNIVQTLNACKKKLDKLILESETLKKMIGEKQALSKTVQEEIETIDGEKAKVKKANAALQKQIEESGMPEVLEYVNQKATAHQLKKELSNLERKVEIAEMQARRRGVAARRTPDEKGWRWRAWAGAWRVLPGFRSRAVRGKKPDRWSLQIFLSILPDFCRDAPIPKIRSIWGENPVSHSIETRKTEGRGKPGVAPDLLSWLCGLMSSKVLIWNHQGHFWPIRLRSI